MENEENKIREDGTKFNLPEKVSPWSKVKQFLFKEIKVELTPYQQKVEKEVNDFLYQEITWEKIKGFFLQEVHFGKKAKEADPVKVNLD